MTRSIIRAAEWTLGPETAEGAPEGMYSAECITCGAQAQPTDNERLPVEVWTIKHTGLNPTHRQFKAMQETFWRVTPAEGNPFRGLGAQRESEPEQAESDAQHTSRQEGAARMRCLGTSFERIAYAYGYADAKEAQRDYEAFMAARRRTQPSA